MTPINSTLPNRTGLVRHSGDTFNNKEAVTNMSKPTSTTKPEKSNNTKSNKNINKNELSTITCAKNTTQQSILSFMSTRNNLNMKHPPF